jgi:hypothetical protein
VRALGGRILAVLIVGVAAAVGFAPAAAASITPTVTLDQSGGTAAGSTVNLGMDLKFAPSSTSDSPKDMKISLPPGVLSDASIDGGACLRTASAVGACQVGTGTASATALGAVPTSASLAFYLVAPPKPGDLAGLVVMATASGSTSQLGSPGDVTIRSGDPNNVGLDISFANLPNTFMTLPISLNELSSRFNGLRMPTSCPNPAATIKVTADSYADPTPRSTSAPLHVTGCSKLAFNPSFRVTATKDKADWGVRIVTDVTQPRTPIQATSRTVVLTLPPKVLVPNATSVLSKGILCTDPSLTTCKTIGSASSTSPLYPTPLGGKVYLTGSVTSPAVTITFPPPFALTLSGTVALATNATTFQGVPDIPLTDLNVTIDGGSAAAFAADCVQPSGIASSTLTTQNGDKTVTVSSPFTVAGCPTAKRGRARIASGSLSGLRVGSPSLRFRLAAGSSAPKLRSFTVKLPAGLGFIKRHVRGHVTVTGASITGAKAKSISLVGRQLVVTLTRAVGSFSVKLGPKALSESTGLRNRVTRHRAGTLVLTVGITDASGKTSTATLRMKPH